MSLTLPASGAGDGDDVLSLESPGGEHQYHLNVSLLHHILHHLYYGEDYGTTTNNSSSTSLYSPYNYYSDYNYYYQNNNNMDYYNMSDTYYDDDERDLSSDDSGIWSTNNQIANISEDDKLPAPLSWDLKATFFILYSLIMTLAIAGNILVIVVIARTPAMRTVTNTFLVSLAVSDLCIASLNMPFQLLFYLQNEWTLGEPICKFSKYIQGVVIVASIFTLTGIAIDR